MQDDKNDKKKERKTLDRIVPLLESYVSLKRHFLRGFVYGIGGFLGATVGIAMILSLFFWSMSKLQVVPILGNFATEIVEFVQLNLTKDTTINQ